MEMSGGGQNVKAGSCGWFDRFQEDRTELEPHRRGDGRSSTPDIHLQFGRS